MLRLTILAAAAALTLVATAATSSAGDVQSQKCDDLQTRCLHSEAGVCLIWHDECQVHKSGGHGSKHSKSARAGRKRRV